MTHWNLAESQRLFGAFENGSGESYRKGRSFVIPADVAAEFQDVAAHRVQPVSSSGMDRVRAAAVRGADFKGDPGACSGRKGEA